MAMAFGALADKSRALELLYRREASLERIHSHALAHLLKMRPNGLFPSATAVPTRGVDIPVCSAETPLGATVQRRFPPGPKQVSELLMWQPNSEVSKKIDDPKWCGAGLQARGRPPGRPSRP